jgi:hypothetical protein
MHRNSRAACEVRGDIWRRARESINWPTLMPSNSSLVRRGSHVSARMPSSCLLSPRGPLGNKHGAGDDEARQDQGRTESADAQPSLRHRLIEEVTQSRAHGSCQDECRPEQHRVRKFSSRSRGVATTMSAAAKINAPYSYPRHRPPRSEPATQSPSAVPSVCENKIVIQ